MSDAHPHEQPTRFRWVVFSLACGTSWLLYLHRYMFSLVKPKIKEEFGLTNTQLGWLDTGNSAAYSLGQVPLGVGVNAFGVHLMLTGMIVVWSIGLGLHGWAQTHGQLLSGRITLGLGQSGVFAGVSQLSRTWFPLRIRTTLQGWAGVFSARGGGVFTNLVIGSVVLGYMGVPWRTAIYILTGVGIAHAVLFWFLYRNVPSEHPFVNSAEAAVLEEVPEGTSPASGTRLSFREMFRGMSRRSICNLGYLNLQSILSNISDNIFSMWIPLFLSDVHGLEFKKMGFYAALPLLGGAFGGALGGWLNDFVFRTTGSRRWSRSAVGLAGKGTAGLLLLFSMLFYEDPYQFCILLFFVKFFSDWSLTTSWGVVTDIGGKASATVFAFNNAIGTLGAIAAPAMYGAISDNFGWKQVFITGAAAYLVCALSWTLIDCRIPVSEEDSTLKSAES